MSDLLLGESKVDRYRLTLMWRQNYPPNINTSRCCQQPICSECFVQIRRSEATITHLESEPACCPFCMETDFGVIYERPLPSIASLSQSALATSSEANASSLCQAISSGSEDAELNVGPGMAPKTQETVRRKSVNAKSKEVVTIGESGGSKPKHPGGCHSACPADSGFSRCF